MIENKEMVKTTHCKAASERSTFMEVELHTAISESSSCLISNVMTQMELVPSCIPLSFLSVGFADSRFTQFVRELCDDFWTYEDCKKSTDASLIICAKRNRVVFVSIEGLDDYAPNWINKIRIDIQEFHKLEIIAVYKMMFPGLKDQLIRSGATSVILDPTVYNTGRLL